MLLPGARVCDSTLLLFIGANQPLSPDTDTTPLFKVVKEPPVLVVLVLDLSGSMDDNTADGTVRTSSNVYPPPLVLLMKRM